MKKKVVAVSGGFDPIHIGHIRMFQAARKLGDELVVILNNDKWLMAKKGFVFMPEMERKAVLEALESVDRVVLTAHKENDSDRSVARVLARLKPDIFANGGDRKSVADIPEVSVCKAHDIKMVFNVGRGGKVQSSSWLTGKIAQTKIDIRPWGSMEIFKAEPHYWIKSITVSPGKRLSLQKHAGRNETWVCIQGEFEAIIGKKTQRLLIGDSVHIKSGQVHRLASKKGGTLVEVGYGPFVREDDIIRLEDDFGRATT